MNFYPHHIGDYTKDTAHLSMLEDGAYRRMLDVYYATERPLPRDQQAIYRLVRARTHAEKLAVDVVLGEFWTESAEGWRNARADAEIARAREKSEKARGSAAHRWHTDRNANASAVAMRTHSEGNAPNNQEPKAKSQKPNARDSSLRSESSADAVGAKKPRQPVAVNGSKTGPTEAAYTMAYQRRYQVEPVVNAKVRGMLSRFVDRVPAEEAPDIAAFYVGHQRGLYVSARHCVDLLLRDAEGLRTEWFTGRRVTETAARQADQTAARGDVFHELIEEARREKAA